MRHVSFASLTTQSGAGRALSSHTFHSAERDWKSFLPRALQSQSIPWYNPVTKEGVVLAGGAVASMLNPGTKPKDFDFFLVVPTVRGHPSENTAEAERRNAAQRLVTTLVKALDESLHDACPSDDGLHLRTLSFHRFASHVIDVMAVR
eukprot:scaffold298696_cov15-Tisochrysis_lutea.AAC.1